MANITTQTIRVDLSTGKVIPSAFTHQNDTARTLVFDIYNGGMPYTMTGNTVKFAYKSPIVNGQYSVIAGASMASGTVSGNKVTVTLPVAYTQISGVGMLTMVITPTSGTVRPVNIRLVVQKSADGDDVVAGASDFPATLEQIADNWYDENIAEWLNENIESIYDSETFKTAIDNWLDDHPEATTTVQDGSITNAKLANDIEKYLVDGLSVSTYRTNNTDCYVVEIPLTDTKGNTISPFIGFSQTETPSEYAQSNGTTFTCNGAANMKKTDDTWQVPYTFSRGEKIYGEEWTGTPIPNDARIVSINEDRSVTEFPLNATLAQLESGGAYTTISVYYKLVENSSALDLSEITANEADRVTAKNPNVAFGVKDDLTLVFFVCDGRTAINAGLTSDETAAQMVSLGCTDAWMMDGGGSSSFNYEGSKINRDIDGNGTIDRMIRFTFNVKDESANDFMAPAFGKVGEEKQRLISQIIPVTNYIQGDLGLTYSNEVGYSLIESNDDLNNYVTTGRFVCNANAIAPTLSNCPTSVSFVMSVEYIDSAKLFYTIKDYNGDTYVRRNHIYSSANHFTEWIHVGVGSVSLTAPSAYNNRVTIDNGGFCKLGKQIQVNMTCTVNTDLSANNDWLICTAFPNAKYISAIAIAATATNGLSMSATINTNGSLVVRNIAAIPTGTVLAVTGTYFCS